MLDLARDDLGKHLQRRGGAGLGLGLQLCDCGGVDGAVGVQELLGDAPHSRTALAVLAAGAHLSAWCAVARELTISRGLPGAPANCPPLPPATVELDWFWATPHTSATTAMTAATAAAAEAMRNFFRSLS